MINNACTPATPCANSRSTVTAAFPMATKARRAPQYLGNDEPRLEDLLSDDVLIRLMARDGVAADQLRALVGFIPN